MNTSRAGTRRRSPIKQLSVVWERDDLADQDEALTKAFQIIFDPKYQSHSSAASATIKDTDQLPAS